MNKIALAGAALALALSAAPALAQDACAKLQAQSDSFKPDLEAAFKLMQARDIAGATVMLPKLEAYLARVPAATPAPQRCGAEVQVYDYHQYLRFDALQKAGKPVPGYAAGTNFVYKALELNSLAYAVGWLHYENKAFDKALVAFNKGLAIAPGDHDLANEVAATLINQQNYAALIPFVDKFLASDSDLEPKGRASMLGGKAIAQAAQGDRVGAKATITLATQLDPANEGLKGLAAQLQ